VAVHTSGAAPLVWIPVDVLRKILEGLVRNAVEYTPDGSAIRISVGREKDNALLEVRDWGVGIAPEKQQLILEQYFVPYDPVNYSSRQPYDFDAGGKGFDLIRMTIFSERYHFKLNLQSEPCRHLNTPDASCPGDRRQCGFAGSGPACLDSGGTTVTLRFPPPEQARDLIRKDQIRRRTRVSAMDNAIQRSDPHAK
jgi:signal transduction histidine kinase